MTNYQTTILTLSLHRENESPEYGENAIHITIDDQPGFPPGLIIKQDIITDPGTIHLSIDELEKLAETARHLITQYPSR